MSTTTIITIYFTRSNSVFRVITSRSVERRTQTYSCICSGLPEHLRIEQKQWLQWKRMYSALFTLPKLRQYVLFLSLSLSRTHSFAVNRKDCNVQWWPQSSLNFSSHSLTHSSFFFFFFWCCHVWCTVSGGLRSLTRRKDNDEQHVHICTVFKWKKVPPVWSL